MILIFSGMLPWGDEEKMKRNKKWGTIKRNKKEMKEEQNMSNKQVIFDL